MGRTAQRFKAEAGAATGGSSARLLVLGIWIVGRRRWGFSDRGASGRLVPKGRNGADARHRQASVHAASWPSPVLPEALPRQQPLSDRPRCDTTHRRSRCTHAQGFAFASCRLSLHADPTLVPPCDTPAVVKVRRWLCSRCPLPTVATAATASRACSPSARQPLPLGSASGRWPLDRGAVNTLPRPCRCCTVAGTWGPPAPECGLRIWNATGGSMGERAIRRAWCLVLVVSVRSRDWPWPLAALLDKPSFSVRARA